jgi:hypothetical protein
MKKIILLLAISASILSIKAQGTFKFGIAGGANIADISSETKTKFLPGFHVGFISEIKLPVKLGVEIGALYSVKGAKFDFDYDFIAIDPINLDPAIPKDGDMVLTYIDIPVVAKIYTFKVMSFQLGPQVSYLISAKYDGNDAKEGLNSVDIGAVAGLGLDVSKFHASVRYNFGLTEISEGAGKNNVIQATLGFWIK